MDLLGKGILEPMLGCIQVIAMGNVLGGATNNIGGCMSALL
jgi:hypothetical protein